MGLQPALEEKKHPHLDLTANPHLLAFHSKAQEGHFKM